MAFQMKKKSIISNDGRVPTFPPKVTHQGAQIFWMIWENPGIAQKDFFHKLYGKPENYDSELKLLGQFKEQLKTAKKGQKRRLKTQIKEIEKYLKKLDNRRHGNAKKWVNHFSTEKAVSKTDKRERTLHPSLEFFFRGLANHYTALVEAKDTQDLPPDLHLRAHFLNKYYSPKKYKQFIKLFNKQIMEDNKIVEGGGKRKKLLQYAYAMEDVAGYKGVLVNTRDKYGANNPYAVLVKYLEEAMFKGIYIMGFVEEGIYTDSWSKFAVAMAKVHWPIFLAMGESPLQKIYSIGPKGWGRD